MQASDLIQDLAGVAGMTHANANVADSLIGLFQTFRPGGLPSSVAWGGVDGGQEFAARLSELYSSVRNSRRADALKDAYFIVRDPPMLSAQRAEVLATGLLDKLLALSQRLGASGELSEFRPQVRILEGKAPKHPRDWSERPQLLHVLQRDLPELVSRQFPQGSLGDLLCEPLYFVATDRMLRDYLRWPLIGGPSRELLKLDPYAEYFALWRHGAKLRIFADDQVDVYLPRRAAGDLIEAPPGP